MDSTSDGVRKGLANDRRDLRRKRVSTDGFTPGPAYTEAFHIPYGMERLGVVLNLPNLATNGGGIATVVVQAESSTDYGNEWSSDPGLLLSTVVPGSVLLSVTVTYNLFRFRIDLNYAGPPGVTAWTVVDVHVRFSPR